MKEDCIFIYGAVTLYGRTFQTVLLTLSYPSFNQVVDRFEAINFLIIVVLQPQTLLANRLV